MHRQAGFSLLETLIASTLLATALLGLGTLTVQTLQDSATTRDFLLADELLADLEGRLALNGGSGAWQASDPWVLLAVDGWRQRVRAALPHATTHLCRDSTPDDGGPSADACDGTGPLTATLLFRTFPNQEAQRPVLEFSP